jgi:uncharacterized protein YdeI (YjbR/CyaY-like superfamily)
MMRMPDGSTGAQFASRAEWRRWLHAHHQSAAEQWFVFGTKRSGAQAVTLSEAEEEALCYGWIDGVGHKVDADHFAVRFTPRRPRSVWSKVNVERVKKLTAAGLMHESGLAVVRASSDSMKEAYAVKDDVPMPPELENALDEEARVAWNRLTDSQRRMWMRKVHNVKRTREKCAREAAALMLAGWRAVDTSATAAKRGLPTREAVLKRLQ